jgi:two-component system, cell cycle sensor histidine kinase and response regulator CckA
MVEEMSALLAASISKKATIEFDFAAELPLIEADATQIHQVVMNLITNASEAIDESGSILLRTGVMAADRAFLASAHLDEDLPEGPYVFLEVSDTGVGMDDDTRARIFDPFFTTKFVGRGLGLAAVLGIVRGHRGTLKVTSAPGRGTTFLVLFPCSSHEAALPERAPEPAADEWRGSGTVLVVDDEAMVREMTGDLLTSLGFEVVLARDGREGVELLGEWGERIEVVLLDLTMPRMGGKEALREMRRVRADVPVVVMSGYSEQEVMGQFSEGAPAGFLQKPFTIAELGDAIRWVKR